MPTAALRSGLPLIALQRQPERRIDDAPRQHEQHEQHDEAVDVGRVAEHVEPVEAEDRRDGDALQAVGAAGDVAVAVGESRSSTSATPSVTISRVRSEPRSTRKLVAKPSTAAARPAASSASVGSLMISYLREQARRIGADAEEGRVAERDDAGIAEDEIEREREQAPRSRSR